MATLTLDGPAALGRSTEPRDIRLRAVWDQIASAAVKVVSTDIFDTLVWRQVPEPVDAFPLVADRLRARGWLAPELGSDAFGRLREQAEVAARWRHREAGHAEVSLAGIYSLLPDWVFGHRATAEQAAQVEFEIEREIIVPDLDVVSLLSRARAGGKRVVAVSDTYFSAAQLKEIFAEPGFAGADFDAIFTSSEHLANKSGGLFDIVLRELGVEAEEVIHLGDNPEADVTIPARLGIRTAYFERQPPAFVQVAEAERRYRAQHARDATEAVTVSGLIAARTKVLSRDDREKLAPALRPYWDYGAMVLGPVFTGFAEWLHEQAAQAGATRLLCLMREGHLLSEVVARAGAYLRTDLQAVPLWVNRGLCLRAAIAEVDREELERFLSRRSPPTVAQVCASLGLSVAEIPEYLGHAHTTIDDPVLRESFLAHLRTDDYLRTRILQGSRDLRRRIAGVIERAAGSDDLLVMADLGYGATIQGELGRILEHAGRPRKSLGLYLFTNERAAWQVFDGIEARGFLASFGAPGDGMRLVMRCPEVLEQTCMPPHGSQQDIDEDFQPVLERCGIPTAQQVEAEAVRTGIFAFQREWARYQTRLPGRIDRLSRARHLLEPILVRAITSPTGDEAVLFGGWMHDENEGSTGVDRLADHSALSRLRYMSPDDARRLPMTEVYWPFALAGLVDEHWPELMAAAAAGQVSWGALGSPLETGRVSVRASIGVDIPESSHMRHEPVRNRLGLSMVRGSIHVPHIQELEISFSERPAIVRVDWIELRCSTQGRADPVVIRLEGDGLRALRRVNCFHLEPNVFIAHGSAPALYADLAGFIPGIVFRIDYEIAFAAMASSPLLPAGGRFTSIEHAAEHVALAERRLAAVEGSTSWRVTSPLRRIGRKLR